MINYVSHGKISLALLKFKLRLNTELLSLKSDVYNESCKYALSLINNMNGVALKIVEALPTENISNNIIYLLKDTSSTEGETKYFQYLRVDEVWEMIGSTSVNMTDYVTNDALLATLSDYISGTQINSILGQYVTQTYLDTVLLDYITSSNLTETVNTSITERMVDYVKKSTLDDMFINVVKSDEFDAYVTRLVDSLKTEFASITYVNEKFNGALTTSKVKKGTGITLVEDTEGNLTISVNTEELNLDEQAGNVWVGTQVEYDALEEDPTTTSKTYLIIGDGTDEPTFAQQLTNIQNELTTLNANQVKMKNAINRLAEAAGLTTEIDEILK